MIVNMVINGLGRTLRRSELDASEQIGSILSLIVVEPTEDGRKGSIYVAQLRLYLIDPKQ